jgi:hypothetical protein
MALRLAGFITSTFDQSDWLNLLGIAGAAVALYLVAKRLGGGGESYASPTDSATSTQISTGQTETPRPEESQEFQEQNSDEPDDEEPPGGEDDLQPRNIEITDWNFATFEIAAGPPDAHSFAEELWVDLHDKSSGHNWKQTYFVATPAGLQKMLHENKSKFMFLPKVLIMDRYDARELRTAVLEDLAAMEEERGDVPPDASDAAEDLN